MSTQTPGSVTAGAPLEISDAEPPKSRLELGRALETVRPDLEAAFGAARQKMGLPHGLSSSPTVMPMVAPGERPFRWSILGVVAAAVAVAVLVAGVGELTSNSAPARGAQGNPAPQTARALSTTAPAGASPSVANAGSGDVLARASSSIPAPESRAAQAAAPTVRRAPPPSRPLRRSAAPAPGGSPRGCEGANCTYSSVLAADRRLRQFYAMAVDAGVPNSVLRRYRNRWSDLQDNAAVRPTQTIRAYRALEEDLARAASRAYD